MFLLNILSSDIVSEIITNKNCHFNWMYSKLCRIFVGDLKWFFFFIQFYLVAIFEACSADENDKSPTMAVPGEGGGVQAPTRYWTNQDLFHYLLLS